jgi:hypothetical protein
MPAERHPEPPRLPSSLTVDEAPGPIEDGDELVARDVRGLAAADARPAAVQFTEVLLRDADFTGSVLVDAVVRDAVFEHAKLANTTIRGGSLTRVLVEGGRLTGLQVAETEIRDCVWRACGAAMASFRHARLERVTFEDCVLREADFTGVRGDWVGSTTATCAALVSTTPSSRGPSSAAVRWTTSRGSRTCVRPRWSWSRC